MGEAGGVDRGSGGDVCLCHYQRLRNSTRVESTPQPLAADHHIAAISPSSYLLFFLSATIYTACAQINACKLFMPQISSNAPTKTNSAPYSWLSCASTLVIHALAKKDLLRELAKPSSPLGVLSQPPGVSLSTPEYPPLPSYSTTFNLSSTI